MPIDTCPAVIDSTLYFDASQVGCEVPVDTASSSSDSECCYLMELQPCVGRPFVVAGRAEKAAAVHDGGWCGEPVRPRVEDLDAELRSALAEGWTRDGLYEHASIASFGRFALELLAVGAPAELVEAAHRAALDEVRHARACFALASAYAGKPIGAGAFPVPQQLEVSHDLAAIAVRTVLEGCVGETVAAAQAAEQREHASDPAVRALLETIAREEADHAELAWRSVAWAVRVGGESVAAAVAKALRTALSDRLPTEPAADLDVGREAHGRLSAAKLAEVRRRTLAEVVAPCAERLLASTPRHRDAGHGKSSRTIRL